MEIRINATFYVDIPIQAPDIINSDSIGEYKAELDCEISNAALMYLTEHISKGDIIINSAEADNSSIFAIEEYGDLLEKWVTEYPKEIKKYESS